ncbi:ELMO domain-containing protein 2, partial [Clarias magur]
MNEHDVHMSTGSHQQNAFYALRSCHQILYGDSGEFFSPDYLCSNPALWCNWTIQVQPGKHVQLYLEDLTPEHMCHLKTDQIHLDEAPVSGGGRRILERCWRRSMYTSASSTVHVVQLIRQNPNPPHRGFYGAYQAFGIPKTPDQFEMMSEKEPVPLKETEDKDAVTETPIHENISNDLDKNAEDVHTEYVEANHSIIPQVNEILAVDAGSFRESRKIRGQEAKNQDVPFHGELAQEEEDDEELVSLPTGIPNWITMEQYTPVWFDGPDSPHNPAPTYTAHTILTSAGTALTQSTKKRVRKRKPGLGQSFPTKATMKKNEVAHFSQVASSSEDPTESTMTEPTVPMDILKSDDDTTLQEHVGLAENIKEKSLPVQTFRLVTESPHLTD